MIELDIKLFRFINESFSSPFFDWLMITVTTPSTWYIPIAMMCIGMVAYDRKLGITAIILCGISIGIGDAFAFHVLKQFFARSRPCITLEDVRLLAGCVDSYSFPSNHAVNSLAFAFSIGSVFRKLLWVLVPIGLLVCLSRVAVGVHYPADVVVGAIVGSAIGFGVGFAGLRYMERKADGK